MLLDLSRACSLFLLTAALSLNIQALELTPHKAVYKAKIKKGISIKGKAVRELKQLKNGQWLYRFDVDSMVADIKESVHFDWKNDQVVPQQYHYTLSGFFIRNREHKVEFDWNKKVARNPLKKKPWELTDIPLNTLDRLGYQMQLSMDVQSGKQEMFYQIAHKGKLKDSHFQVITEETIDTVLGLVDSIFLKKIRSNDSKRETSLWFSKEHPFLLLRMVQRESDGETYEINLTSASIKGKPFLAK